VAYEIFVDAGAWIAINDVRDQYHGVAAEIYPRLLRQYQVLVTTNLVIAEAYVMIRRVGGHQPAVNFLQAIQQSSRILKIYSNVDVEVQAEEILRCYADQDFSLVDAVSFTVMHERGIAEAFAFDRHFLTAGFSLIPLQADLNS
jgi:predicted nucleic acid-binding protein